MKSRLLIAILTAAVFALGYFAGLWVERTRPVPAPPAALMAEFATRRPSVATDNKAAPARSPQNRAQLAAEIESLRPQIASYRARFDQLIADFDRDLSVILTPEQRTQYAASQKRRAERTAKGETAAATAAQPLTDDEIDRLKLQPLYSVLSMVAPTMKQDALIKDLKLDAVQQTKARDLLRARREKFLAIVDSTPPPSIMLSRLAPAAQRIGAEPVKK